MSPKILDYISTEMEKAGAGEWVGPCPYCGGEDRFSVTAKKDKPGGGLFFCRGSSVGRSGCDWSGDIFTLLQDLHGFEYCEARAHLGLEPDEFCKDASKKQKEEAERKRRELERKKRKKYQSWRRLVRRSWIKAHMTDAEMKRWQKLLEPPERVRKARRVLNGYLDTYTESKGDTSPLSQSSDKSGVYLYGGLRWANLPEDRLPKAKRLLKNARKTENEINEEKSRAESFLNKVEERLNNEGVFFEDYEEKARLKQQFSESRSLNI